jgi:hypothetical protein
MEKSNGYRDLWKKADYFIMNYKAQISAEEHLEMVNISEFVILGLEQTNNGNCASI